MFQVTYDVILWLIRYYVNAFKQTEQNDFQSFLDPELNALLSVEDDVKFQTFKILQTSVGRPNLKATLLY